MKRYCHFYAAVFVGVAQIFLPSHSVAEQTIEVTQARVREVCGKDLKDDGKGTMGCEKVGCRPNATCSWSCGGPEGNGCRLNVMESEFKVLPKAKKPQKQ